MAKDLQFTFRRPCLELSGEIGSLAELIGYMQEESASLTLMFGDDMEMTVQRINTASGEPVTQQQQETPTVTEAPKKPRGRPAKPPVEAVAPDPLPVPAAAPPVLPSPPTAPVAPIAPPPPAPALAAPADGGIPPFLARPLPGAPAPAAPPPVGVLGPKVVKALDEHREGKPDGGQALADWLAAAGLTIKGKTYDEACRALLMVSDEKITAAGILQPLGLAT